MLVKTQNYVISVLTHLCSLKRKFANTDLSVFPVLAKILKYIIQNPLPACVGMVLVRVAVCTVLYCIVYCQECIRTRVCNARSLQYGALAQRNFK